MSSFLLPHLGAVPLRTAYVGSALQPLPLNNNTYAPGQIWVARASDAGAQAATTIARARADEPGLRALLEQLDDYQRALYPRARRPPLELDALLQPSARLLVVRDARQQALACGAVVLREDYAELNGMMVLPAQRGRGLGSQLLRALERESVRAGRPLLRLADRRAPARCPAPL